MSETRGGSRRKIQFVNLFTINYLALRAGHVLDPLQQSLPNGLKTKAAGEGDAVKACFDCFQVTWIGQPSFFLCLGSVCGGKYAGRDRRGNKFFSLLFFLEIEEEALAQVMMGSSIRWG